MASNPKIFTRLIIYPSDVAIITGQSIRAARAILARFKKACGKQSHEFVTIPEFCKFYGLDINLIKDILVL